MLLEPAPRRAAHRLESAAGRFVVLVESLVAPDHFAIDPSQTDRLAQGIEEDIGLLGDELAFEGKEIAGIGKDGLETAGRDLP